MLQVKYVCLYVPCMLQVLICVLSTGAFTTRIHGVSAHMCAQPYPYSLLPLAIKLVSMKLEVVAADCFKK